MKKYVEMFVVGAVWAAVILTLLWLLGLLTGCASVSQLRSVCVRYTDSEGYLRGRYATFNDFGAKANAKRNPFSHEGICDANTQGPARETFVCVAGPCGQDVSLSVWEDEVIAWVDAGGIVGACKEMEGVFEGDCVLRLHNYEGPKDFRQWQKWMRELKRSRRP